MRETDKKLSETDIPGSGAPPFRVGLLLVPGFALMSYACTVEPLRAANLLSRHQLFDVVHFATDTAVASSGGTHVATVRQPAKTQNLDLLLVVAGGDPFAVDDPQAFNWLQILARRGVQIGGVSGGPVILANAGLMAGRRLTVHWEHASALAEQFPDLLIERRLFVIDRDRLTCGGGTAPLDLMHALISTRHGGPFARLVSDWFLHTEIRGAAAPQRGDVAERLGVRSPHVLSAVSAMESHIGDPLSLSQIAMIAGVTTRHLNRLFSDAFGESAMQYYRNLRLDTARRLVQSTALRLGDVSDATGFAHAGHLSNAYHARFGTRPNADRMAGRGAQPLSAGFPPPGL